MIPTLVSALLHDIRLDLPLAKLEAIPSAVVDAWRAGNIGPLETAVAAALADTVDLSAVPIVGAALEGEKDKIAAELVTQVAGLVATAPETIAAHGRVRALVDLLVDTPVKAHAVLAMGPVYLAAHPIERRRAKELVG